MITLPLPTLAPRSLRMYGENPFGEPIWRCVFAPSVKKIVGGAFADGFTGYRARPAYRHIGNFWVLEKWISAKEMTGKTEIEYDAVFRDASTGLYPTGPYPHRGCYHYCETLSCSPEDANFDLLIKLITKAKYNSTQDNLNAIMKSFDDKEKSDQAERFDRMKERLPAYGIRAASFRSHVKPTKSAPMTRTANELGLPRSGPSVREVNHAV